MGRPSKYNWRDIRKHYEAGMTQSEIVKKFGCDKGTLSKKIKQEGWGVSQLANDYISEAIEVNQLKNQLNQQDERVCEIADEIIIEKTKYISFFSNSALKNQLMANTALDGIESKRDGVSKDDFDSIERHSRITQRNKETVLGKDKTTEIHNTNAQQNNETKRITIVRRSDRTE